ncbi:hypothetical protein [Kordiimonas laminariae]|uniref:hypothetical protein n=1 Tax=Kordiimonas laminariae TaxID=2917717 RepID=UPI001FF1184F|nr:hypothetical protein [Kordiimonas laminariae]MCK0068234.1 hypothetical protein [Kordiimonas laminariae]
MTAFRKEYADKIRIIASRNDLKNVEKTDGIKLFEPITVEVDNPAAPDGDIGFSKAVELAEPIICELCEISIEELQTFSIDYFMNVSITAKAL